MTSDLLLEPARVAVRGTAAFRNFAVVSFSSIQRLLCHPLHPDNTVYKLCLHPNRYFRAKQLRSTLFTPHFIFLFISHIFKNPNIYILKTFKSDNWLI